MIAAVKVAGEVSCLVSILFNRNGKLGLWEEDDDLGRWTLGECGKR